MVGECKALGGHTTSHRKLFGPLDPLLLKMTPFSTLLV
jgi:hypothetical protein